MYPLACRMEPVLDTQSSPAHGTLTSPPVTTPITSTSDSTANNHFNQTTTTTTIENHTEGLGSESSPPPPPLAQSSVGIGRPNRLTQRDSSQYQLVFDIEDTSSETSLTDSPLISDASKRVLQQFALSATQHSGVSESEDQTGSKSEIPAVQQAVPDPESLYDREKRVSSAAEDDKLNSVDSAESAAPIRGEVAGGVAMEIEIPPDTDPSHQQQQQNGISATSDSGLLTSSTQNSASFNPGNLDGNSTISLPSGRGVVTSSPKSRSRSPESDVKLEDIALRSRSVSEEEEEGEGRPRQKPHPLSFLTSDSELGETPTPPPNAPAYSPILNTSGESVLLRFYVNGLRVSPC